MKTASESQNLYLENNEYFYKAGMLPAEPQHLVLYFSIEATISYKQKLHKSIAYPSASTLNLSDIISGSVKLSMFVFKTHKYLLYDLLHITAPHFR